MERLANALNAAAGAVNNQIAQFEAQVETINRVILLRNVITVVGVASIIFTVVSLSLIGLAVTGILILGQFHLDEHLTAKIEQIRSALRMIGLDRALVGGGESNIRGFRKPIHIRLN